MSLVLLVPAFSTFLHSDKSFSLSLSDRLHLHEAEASVKPRPAPGLHWLCPTNVPHPLYSTLAIAVLRDVRWASRCISILESWCTIRGTVHSVTRTSSAGFRPMVPICHFCITLINWVPADLCSCIFIQEEIRVSQGSVLGDVFDMMHSRMAFCCQGLSPYIPPCLDGPWWTIQAEREWQERESFAQPFACIFSSSAAINFY